MSTHHTLLTLSIGTNHQKPDIQKFQTREVHMQQ